MDRSELGKGADAIEQTRGSAKKVTNLTCLNQQPQNGVPFSDHGHFLLEKQRFQKGVLLNKRFFSDFFVLSFVSTVDPKIWSSSTTHKQPRPQQTPSYRRNAPAGTQPAAADTSAQEPQKTSIWCCEVQNKTFPKLNSTILEADSGDMSSSTQILDLFANPTHNPPA